MTNVQAKYIRYNSEQLNEITPFLKRSHADVLRLALGGVTMTSMATELNVPLGTIKSRLNRARLAFHAEYTARHPDPEGPELAVGA